MLPSTGATIVVVSEGTVDESVCVGVTVGVSTWLVCVSCPELSEVEVSDVAEGLGSGSGVLDGVGVGVGDGEVAVSTVTDSEVDGEGEGDGSIGVGPEGSVTTPL